MSKLEDLETKIQLLILSYLDIKSLMQCRLLSKKFLKNVSLIRVESLFVILSSSSNFDSDYFSGSLRKYFYTNDLVCFSTSLSASNMGFVDSIIIKSILSNLKRLRIEEQVTIHRSFNIEHINQFTNLEHLEIALYNNKNNYVLRLNNLRILFIMSMSSAFNLVVDTPKLVALGSEYSINYIEFLSPQKITYFSTSDMCTLKPKIEFFLNLEYFFLKFDVINEHCLPDFSAFIHLKELHLNGVLPRVLDIIWDQRRSKNLSFEIYVSGFKVDTVDDIDIFKDKLSAFENIISLRFTHNFSDLLPFNYSRISDANPIHVSNINYNSLIKNFNNKIPNDFHKKVNVESVSVGLSKNIIDHKMFIKFLTKVKTITRLYIYNVPFSNEFYDNLGFNCPYLLHLTINYPNDTSPNSDFLLNFKKLRSIELNIPLPLDLVERIFNPKYFKLLKFKFNHQSIDLIRVDRGIQIKKLAIQFDDLASAMSILKKQENINLNPDDIY